MQPYNPYYFNVPNYMSSRYQGINQPDPYNQSFMNNSYPNANQNMQQSFNLQGKAVDSIDVVKAMDVPLDGSIIYFPKTDGTEIYTKQLQKDGTSKICTFKLKTDSESTERHQNQNSDIKKEDIEKITSDIVEVKKSIENNFSNILKKIDSFQKEEENKRP